MAIAAEILTHLRAEAGQFKAEINSAEKATQGFATGTQRMTAIGQASWVALGAAAVAVSVISVKAALEHEQAHARLVTAIKNSGSTWAAQADAVENTDSKLRRLGFTDTDTESSLAKLTNATHDTRKATDLMGLASDVARGRHIDLSAATDILVKVESGRVGLLGRLGINTKDATGATISQEEAVRRLTATYGGQASAYTETFAGKMQVLQAQLEHVAVAIGDFLIPVLESIGSAVADVIDWFSKHQAAALALAAVIGGPLVAAMAAAAAEMAAAAVGGIVEFWSGFAVILTDVVIPSIANVITWLAGLSVAEAAATLGVSLLVAGAAALATGLIKLGGGTSDFVKSADKQIDLFVKGATATGTYSEQMAKLKAQYDSQQNSVNNNTVALKAANAEYNTAQGRTSELRDRIVTLNDGLNYHQRAADDTAAAMKKLNAEHEKGVAAAIKTAEVYGIVIPDQFAKNTAAVKAIQSQIPELTDKYGQMFTQIIVGAGVTGDALKALNKDTDNFAKTMEGSISKATDPFSKFADATAVSEGDLEQFFVGSNQQAAAWADEITGLINRGVNLGIINQMAQAGPGSKPALDAFVQMVDAHGVDWVNSVAASGQQAAKATEDAYNAMAGVAAIKAAEMATVTNAATKDMATGGVANLKALATGSDANLAAMAVSAIFHLGQIGYAVNTLPTEHGVNITVTQSGVDVGELKRQLGDIPGQYVADIVINSHGEADPIGALTGTIMGDAILQGWPELGDKLMGQGAIDAAARRKANR